MTSRLTATTNWPVFPRFTDPLRHWSKLSPDRVALVDRRRKSRQTYAELDTAADVWAGNLRERGVERGDRVVVIATNRREIPELFFACCRMGASLIPLNWRLAGAELDAILTHAGPVLVMGEARFLDLISPNNPAISSRSMYVDLDDPPIDHTPNSKPSVAIADAELAPDDPALILYTSGSTGLPKGVIIPHRQILFNAVATAIAWELGPSDSRALLPAISRFSIIVSRIGYQLITDVMLQV